MHELPLRLMEKKGFIAAWTKCPPKIRIFGKCESIFTTHVATESHVLRESDGFSAACYLGFFFLNSPESPLRGFVWPGFALFPCNACCNMPPAIPFTSGTNFGSEVVP